MKINKCLKCGFSDNKDIDMRCINCGADLTAINKSGIDQQLDNPTVIVKSMHNLPVSESPTVVIKPTQQKLPDLPPSVAIEQPAIPRISSPESSTVIVKPPQQSAAVPDAGSPKSLQARLIIKQGARKGHVFEICSEEVIIGRWDADSGAFPEIDLTEDDHGSFVSRKHARIILKNDAYYIEDVGSNNGTFINKKTKLVPGNTYKLQSGDEILVGRIFLDFFINE